MSFREKLKKAFHKSSSPVSSKPASPTIQPIPQQEQRWPSNVYRPDEPMPRPKYRAPVKKEHKEKLEAFNFDSSWRRQSNVSLHSPGGSRQPSRRNSRQSRKSMSGPSGLGRDSMEARRRSVVSPVRNGSVGGQERRFRHSVRMAQPMVLQPEAELSDDDMAHDGISRILSNETVPEIWIDRPSPLKAPTTRVTTIAVRPDHTARLSYLSVASSDGYFAAETQHGWAATDNSSSTASKADSGTSDQHFLSHLELAGADYKMFSDDDLAKTMGWKRRSGGARVR